MICSCVFYVWVIVAVGFLGATISGQDSYMQQSVMMVNDVSTTAVSTSTDDYIIAYKNTLDETIMVAQFYQTYEDGTNVAPFSKACDEVYADNEAVLALLDRDMMCLIPEELPNGIQFTQQGIANSAFSLRVTTCKKQAQVWASFTAHAATVYPDWYSNCADIPGLASLSGQAISTNVKVLGRQFTVEQYRAGETDQSDMAYFLLNEYDQGFYNNTQMTVNLNYDRIKSSVRNSALANNGVVGQNMGDQYQFWSFRNSFLGFMMVRFDVLSPPAIGDQTVYIQFEFKQTPNVLMQSINLNRGLVAALAIFGGFMVGIFWILQMLSFCFHKYEVEQEMADELNVYSPQVDSMGTKHHEVVDTVNRQSENNMNACERLFCCCNKFARRNEAFDEAVKKMDQQLDFVEMLQTMRQVKLLRNLSEDGGDYSDLIRFCKPFRVATRDDAHFPEKEVTLPMQKQQMLAQTLSERNDFETQLMKDICKREPRAPNARVNASADLPVESLELPKDTPAEEVKLAVEEDDRIVEETAE